jgi:hypothetical protein
MARGWESKSVEDQQQAATAAKDARDERRLTPQQRQQQTQKQSLLLSRAQTVSRLKSVTNPKYRAQLELALRDLDEQLREFD